MFLFHQIQQKQQQFLRHVDTHKSLITPKFEKKYDKTHAQNTHANAVPQVGMQNSALAVVLAQRGLSDPLSAIPGAVSATCHSLIGSALAAYWRTGDRALPNAPPEASPSKGARGGGDGAGSSDDLYDAGGGI